MSISFHYRIWVLGLLICSPPVFAAQAESDPAEIALGERLFLETRFAQFFYAQGQGGDPVMEHTETVDGVLPGPFARQSMNCAACHLVDQQLDARNAGMRTYSDFARRSPIPQRRDGKTHAVRNSPPLVNASLPRRGGPLFHFDGEFSTLHELVKETYIGRNYGWLPDERDQAIRHFATIIRSDDGAGALAQEFGGAYRIVLKGVDASIPEALRLPEAYRIDVETASDEEIFEQVTRLTEVYVEALEFTRADDGAFTGSPYDQFLMKNGLPRQPRNGESAAAYSQRLLREIRRLNSPQFVMSQDHQFTFHEQEYLFGPKELKGMLLFFSRSSHGERSQRQAGNCVACHAPPAFTDFALHNTGVTQFEYDGIHGQGSFTRLFIPSLQTRNRNLLKWLPASAQHPNALEPFRAIPSIDRPGATDLGVWNIFANPDAPRAQRKLRRLLCREQLRANGPSAQVGWRSKFQCKKTTLLQRSIATFKTPGLRDLGHSAPYMHNGQFDSLEAVIQFYITVSEQVRSGDLRNPAPALRRIHLRSEDVIPIAAFLRALNEDYE